MESAAREIGRRLFLLRQFLILQRHPRREQLRAALSELLFHLRVRRSQHFARDGGGGHDRLHQMADVRKVLERGVGVAVALEHHCLALILVEEDFVLERAPVLGPHDLHGRFRQPLPFLDLAGMKFDPCDSFDLVHCCSFSKFPAQRFRSRLVPALNSLKLANDRRIARCFAARSYWLVRNLTRALGLLWTLSQQKIERALAACARWSALKDS